MRKEYEEVDVADEFVEKTFVEPEIELISNIGVVSGCDRLNVRTNPAVESDNVVCVIEKDDLLVIDIRELVDGWYKVYTEAGIEGFCMQQYITIKE